MKTIGYSLMLSLALQGSLQAQTDAPSAPADTNAPAASPSYAVLSRDANSRVWASISRQTNAAGEGVWVTNTYTELADGLCRWTGTGWVDASETIAITNDGAGTTNSRHYVHFMGDANTAGGAVHLVTPDQLDFYSRVYGLAYEDKVTGTNLLMGPLQDTQGVVVGDRTVLYTNAFSGPITADLEYENLKAGLEQNVVLRSQLPAPASLGMNNDTTTVQLWTEFFSPPAPQEMTVTNNGAAEDVALDWGTMSMGVGRAFSMPSQGRTNALQWGKVKKHWVQLGGRTFLIEEMPWSAVARATKNLPLHASAAEPGASIKNLASMRPVPPQSAVSTLAPRPLLAARAMREEPGLVMDYSVLSGGNTNFTFQGDTTYYISGAYTVSGTNIIEGGSVLKFSGSGYIYVNNASYASELISEAGPYRMAVLTSVNDNAAGDVISGSTGSPGTGGTYLDLNVTTLASTLSYLRFHYAGTGLEQDLEGSLNANTVWHSQFVDCSTAVAVSPNDCDCYNTYQSLYNVLLANCSVGVENINWTEGAQMWLDAENITADQVEALLESWSGDTNDSAYSDLENCVLTGVNYQILNLDDDSSTNIYEVDCATSYSSNLYQTAGAGAYYLTNGSPYRGVGWTGVNGTLLANLRQKTTYPPVVYSNGVIAVATNLGPTVARESTFPDIGYAYDPLDYALYNMVVSNGSVTVAAGTALAVCGSQYGLWLRSNAVVNCVGTPTSPDYIVRYNTVQEQSNTNWRSTNWLGSIVAPDQADSSSANFAFTDWSVLADDGQLYTYAYPCPVGLMSCQAYSGVFYDIGPTISSTNSLYQRVKTQWTDTGVVTSNSYYNNLFLKGSVTVTHTNTGTWTFRDNLFDQALVTNLLSSTINVCSNNAYVTNFTTLSPEHNDVILTGSPAYQTGTLGQNYYPTNLALVHAGSQLASAIGLYHYTITTNNAIEGTNTVSIGYHYVATDSSGNPLDTNGDGIPDYLEDANGDGVYDTGDLGNWIINPYNGLTYANGLEVFTPLH